MTLSSNYYPTILVDHVMKCKTKTLKNRIRILIHKVQLLLIIYTFKS